MYLTSGQFVIMYLMMTVTVMSMVIGFTIIVQKILLGGNVNDSITTKIVKRMFFIAYRASLVSGMGFLQSRDDVTEEEVWENVRTRGDYPMIHNNEPEKGAAYGDYVFGRMVKLTLRWDDHVIIFPDRDPVVGYQSWVSIYPTYNDLYLKALEELEIDRPPKIASAGTI